MKTRFFTTPQGSQPVRAYIDDQEVREKARIAGVLARIQERGLRDNLLHTRQVRSKLWEIKISRHRLLYFVNGEGVLVLLHAFAKQSQRAPRGEIETALARLAIAEGSDHGPSIKESSKKSR